MTWRGMRQETPQPSATLCKRWYPTGRSPFWMTWRCTPPTTSSP